MEKLSRQETVIRITLLGVVIGLLIIILFYWLIFSVSGENFSFAYIGGLHTRFPGIYLVDLLPLFLGTVSGLLAHRRSGIFEKLREQVRDITVKKERIKQFTNDLIAGNLQYQIRFTDEDKDLSDTLMNLQSNLAAHREAEKRIRLEENQRNYVSEGLAEFGDILRNHASNPETLASTLISRLVRYLDVNQGGFFLVDQEKGRKVIRMTACYAYDRKKFPDKTIEWGDGLIGAVAFEKKSYYTDKIPDGYLTITSGLGKANPGFLLIAPLVFRDEVCGIIELASFHPIESFKIQFIEKIAENTATTISTMRSVLRTEELLKETREQARQLSLQEEQVRQNLEILKKTRDEAARQAEQFISFTNTVNHTLIRAEYNMDGILLYANTRFLKKLGYSGNKEVEGQHISMFINDKDMDWFNSIWMELSKGGKHFEGYMKHITKQGQDVWTMATYTCIRKDDGTAEKVLFLAIDTTEQKKQSLEYEGEIGAINRLIPKAEFRPDGAFIRCNELFEKSMKYTQRELSQLSVFDFTGTSEQEQFNDIWEKVIRGDAYQGQIRMRTKYEETVWLRATFTSIDNMYGDIEKVIFMANDITREKELEINYKRHHEDLIKNEEELKLTALDLQRKLDELNARRKEDKMGFEQEIKHYRSILEGLPLPVLIINSPGFLMFRNSAAEKLFGLRKKECTGKRISECFPGEGHSEAFESFILPDREKKTGLHRNQVILTPGGEKIKADLVILKAELRDEIHFTMVLRT